MSVFFETAPPFAERKGRWQEIVSLEIFDAPMHELARGWGLHVDEGPEWLFVRLAPTSDDRAAEPPLAAAVAELAQSRQKWRIVFELDHSVDLRSFLVGQLVTLHKRLHLQRGALRLCGLSQPNYDVIRMMRLSTHLPHYPDREAASRG